MSDNSNNINNREHVSLSFDVVAVSVLLFCFSQYHHSQHQGQGHQNQFMLYNNNNKYLERLTCTGPKRLHVLYKYILVKIQCIQHECTHTHACTHTDSQRHACVHTHTHTPVGVCINVKFSYHTISLVETSCSKALWIICCYIITLMVLNACVHLYVITQITLTMTSSHP